MGHEKSITIGSDKRIFNIPSVVGGRQLSDKQAFQRFKRTGKHFGMFRKMPGALLSAKTRSRYGHGEEKLPKGTRIWDARFLKGAGRHKSNPFRRRRGVK